MLTLSERFVPGAGQLGQAEGGEGRVPGGEARETWRPGPVPGEAGGV